MGGWVETWKVIAVFAVLVLLCAAIVVYLLHDYSTHHGVREAELQQQSDAREAEWTAAYEGLRAELEQQHSTSEASSKAAYDALATELQQQRSAYAELWTNHETLKSRIPKDQFFVIEQGTYPGQVFVGLAISKEDFAAKLQALFDNSLTTAELEPLDKHVGGLVFELRGKTVLWVAPTTDPVFYHSVLAHEIFHTVECLFMYVGLRHEPPSEAFAHQIQHLTREIYQRATT